MNKRTGFTLVELSIVLVIIGLLIGGLLVGQSLTETAELNKFIKRHSSFEVATNQYKLKFKELPGDGPQAAVFFNNYTHCTIATHPGFFNKDNFIENGWERDCFWAPLVYSDFIREPLWVDSSDYHKCAKTDIDNMWRCRPRARANYTSTIMVADSVYIYVARVVGGSGNNMHGIYSTKFSKALDSKSDDGTSGSGKIRYVGGWEDPNKADCGVITIDNDKACVLYLNLLPDSHIF